MIELLEQTNYHAHLTFTEAINQPDKEQYIEAIVSEFSAYIKLNEKFRIVDRKSVPDDEHTYNTIWAIKIKQDGRYKARLNCRGDQGPPAEDTYSPVLPREATHTRSTFG
eukprot:Pgem_evm2s4114